MQWTSWADAVADAFEEDQQVEIRIRNTYDEGSRQLSTTIDAMELDDLGGTLKMTVCLIEDNIVGMQITPTQGLVSDYVHRHVFRTTLNGAYGENITFDANHLVNRTFSLTLSDAYNADNCYVIAYIYDESRDMKILQTAIKEIR